MLDVYLEIEGEEITLNQSRRADYDNCHRLYYWRYVVGLDVDRPRWALEIGTAWHKALAELGSGKTVDEAVDIAIASLDDELPKRMLPGDEEELVKAKEIVEKLTRGYVAHWAEQAALWKPLGQEIEGRIEVGKGTGIFLKFKIDKLVLWHNNIWILDAKSAGRLDLRDFLKYEMDLQFTSYVYAVNKWFEENYPQLRLAGIIVDAGIKTTLPQFKREQYFRSEAELKEFEEEFVEVAKELILRYRRVREGENPKTVFYKRTAHCFNYGGTCVYRELCLKDTPARRMMFVKRKPDYVDPYPRPAWQADSTPGPRPQDAQGNTPPPRAESATSEDGSSDTPQSS